MKRRRNPESELSDVVKYVVGAAITASIINSLVDPSFEHLTADTEALDRDIHSTPLVLNDSGRVVPPTSDHAALVEAAPAPAQAPAPAANTAPTPQNYNCPSGQLYDWGKQRCMTPDEIAHIQYPSSPQQTAQSTITSSPTSSSLGPTGPAGGSVSFTFSGHPMRRLLRRF